jgi:copper chaperone CopZ
MRTSLALGVLLCAGLLRAAEKTETIKVSGWHSKGDAYKTEVSVRAVKGVANATANYSQTVIVVTYDDKQASRQQIDKAIADAGYSAAK